MKHNRRTTILMVLSAALLLAGCATTAAPVPTEVAPVAIVAEPGDYSAKIYELNPEAVADIPEESVPLASSADFNPSPENPMTKRQAEALAIQTAGLTHDDVSFLFAKEDTEDSIPVFEVSFRSGNFAYEFEIARETGEILTYEKEDIRKG